MSDVKRYYYCHEDDITFVESGLMVSPITNSLISADVCDDGDLKVKGDMWTWLIFDCDTGKCVDLAPTKAVAEDFIAKYGTLVKNINDLSHTSAYDRAMAIL